MWAIIGSVIKYYRLGWEEILWKRSLQNILMLVNSIPKYDSKKDGKGNKEKCQENGKITKISELMKPYG